MHRLTARLLLVLLLVGVFAPVALAISATPVHACCLRKAMHGSFSHNAEFRSLAGCCQHDCCRPLTVSRSVHLSRLPCVEITPTFARLQSEVPQARFTVDANNAYSGRAPPQFSIA
jgi:hypothetical protein